MKIKNTAGFRSWFKNLVEARKHASDFYDENFMGVQHGTQSGFFNMYHGDKEDIYGFLRKEVEMAEDGQAIYEFVQNAADSSSTDFYMFFNDKYFLAINNGEVFKKEGLKSILNIGQSHGKTDPDKIGRYGIGFKLVHRLVGKSQGLDELLNTDNQGYRGPVLFSWSNRTQFDNLLSYQTITNGDFDSDEFAWLLKILITNFPAAPGEKIRDHNYKEDVPFKEEELKEFQFFLKECLPNINVSALNSGTMFFIKLGEGKYSYLKEQENEYIGGLETSMHFLKKLNKIVINKKVIHKNENIDNILRLSIPKDTEAFNRIGLTEERDKMADIRFDVLYAQDESTALELKQHPNIYKFFPAVKEVNNLSLVLNSNVFALSSNRQNLDNTGINKELLKSLASLITHKMSDFQTNHFNKYLGLFTSVLLSDPPSSHAGTGWQKEYFYDLLLSYIKNNVPTKDENFLPTSKVVIKKTKLNIDPADFVLVEKEWFYLDADYKGKIIDEAKNDEKLGLESWGLKHLLEEGDVGLINAWIKSSSDKQYLLFLEELDKLKRHDVLDHDIEFIKGSDGLFYSINEVKDTSEILLKNNNTKDITSILDKLDIVISTINFDEYVNLKIHLMSLGFKYLDSACRIYSNFLQPNESFNALNILEKKNLFNVVSSWQGIKPGDISDWKLFNNINGELKEFSYLLPFQHDQPEWLKPYIINSEEYFAELDDYLVQEEDVFEGILHSNWDNIIDDNNWGSMEAKQLYEYSINAFTNCKNQRFDLTDLRYLYVNGNFEKTSDVFFHSSFISLSNYNNLKPVFAKLFDYKLVDADVLKYLCQKPFDTKDDDLLKHINEIELSLQDIKGLLSFYKENDLNIFNHIVISENDSSYSIETKLKNHQYYSESDELNEFIAEHLSNVILLPEKLRDFRKSEGILRNKDLYKKVMANVRDIEELYKEFVLLIEHKDILKEYINKLDDIELDITNGIKSDSFEYKVVSDLIRDFEVEEFEDIRNKFIIRKGDIAFNLTEVNNTNDVVFKVENNKYTLDISKILPKIDSYVNTAVLEEFKKILFSLELPESKVEALFNIDIDEEDLIYQIADQLSSQLDDNILETPEQLAFTALYTIYYDSKYLNSFKLTVIDDDKSDSLDYLFYTQDASFLRKDCVLNESYHGINKLLKIRKDNPLFKVNDKFKLALYPCFDDSGEFITEWVDEDLDEQSCLDLFEHLYAEYNRRGKDSQRDFLEIDDWNEFNSDTKFEEICGFNPNSVIYTVDDTAYLLETEKLPEWLYNWVAEDKSKTEFLAALGILTDGNAVNLRKYLVSDIDDAASIDTIPDVILHNSMEWLSEFIGDEEMIIIDPVRITSLDACIEKLEDSAAIEIEVDDDRLNEALDWENEGYVQLIEDEEISFEVKTIDTLIPYVYVFNGKLIARKTVGDYLFKDDVIYVNSSKSVELILANLAAADELDTDEVRLITDRGLSRIKELEEEVKRLKSQVNSAASYQNEEGISSSNLIHDNTDREVRFDISAEAKKMIIEKLKEKGYIIPDNVSLSWTIVNGIINPVTNKVIKAVLKSARKGEIYFTPNEWLALCTEDAQLFILGNGNTVLNITIDDLVRANEKFHLRFDTEQFAVKSNLNTFAEIFRQLPDTHFLFKAPISTADFFQPFSWFNKNMTAIDLTEDELDAIN